jgi:hypothetical protein
MSDDRVDVSDSLVTDSQPRHPLPHDLLQNFTNPHRFSNLAGVISMWMTKFPDLIDVTLVMSDIARMARHINDTAESALLWRDRWLMSWMFMPIMQRTLALTRADLTGPSSNRGHTIREVLRLTLLVFLGIVNRGFRNSPDGIAIYRDRVTQLLPSIVVTWSPFFELRLWILVVVGLVAEGEERVWCICEIVATMRQLGFSGWNEALSTDKGVIWVDELMEKDAITLGEEIKN